MHVHKARDFPRLFSPLPARKFPRRQTDRMLFFEWLPGRGFSPLSGNSSIVARGIFPVKGQQRAKV